MMLDNIDDNTQPATTPLDNSLIVYFARDLNRRVQDLKDKVMHKIEALHPGNKGVATEQIRSTTDFGSGWMAFKNVAKSIAEDVGFVAKKAAPQTWVHPDAEEAVTKRFKEILKPDHFAKRTAAWEAAHPTSPGIWISDEPHKVPSKLGNIRHKLQARPTAGLVTNVLTDPAFTQAHKTFTGKSYSNLL